MSHDEPVAEPEQSAADLPGADLIEPSSDQPEPSPLDAAGSGRSAGARGSVLRALRSEFSLVFGRRRNLVLLAGLAAIPVLVGVAVKLFGGEMPQHGGANVMNLITQNGFFLVFTSLIAATPLFLPLVVGIVSGDAIAGEAGSGTLRYLLTVPASRTRVLAVKTVTSAAFTFAAVFAITAVGLITGALLFGIGDVTLLSGSTVPVGEALLRALAVAVFVSLSMLSLVGIGTLFSTLTEVPVAAMAATVVFAITSTVLDSIPQLDMIHGALPTHYWLDFWEFLRLDVSFTTLGHGLAVQGAWAAIALTAAWARFTTADISS